MSHTSGRNVLTSLRNITAIAVAHSALRLMSFWTAIFLPFIYVPLTVVNHHWIVQFPNFMTVITVHVIAILGGMDHGAFDQHV